MSGRFGATLTEVRERWTLLQVLTAHEILEAIDEAEAEQEAIERAKNPPKV